ncbi:nuclear transcription factor Y subunit B-10-like [Abrus precatorius]|uniref:Nuclear transcription factor Y subunit B-10-like n=1 Tax=Abrus precatorius TaxID=3816 RepID=A0A8B8ML30_ABRPR|nr:nuclear transcription factor Y subunit B-10-like [Abrus precatorius]
MEFITTMTVKDLQDGNGSGVNNQDLAVQAPAAEALQENPNLPLATVKRLMRKGLPLHAKVTEESKETMLECVTEFIGFITSEANHQCQLEHRRTVSGEDLIRALKTLGFNNYAVVLSLYLERLRQNDAAARFPSRVPPPPPPSFATGFPVIPAPFQTFPETLEMGGFYNGGSGGFYNGVSGGSGSGNATMANFCYDPFA